MTAFTDVAHPRRLIKSLRLTLCPWKPSDRSLLGARTSPSACHWSAGRPAGDDQDLPHPAGHRFLDDELDRRLVHERDHFLRLGFRVGEETSAETGRWNDRLHGRSPSAAIDKILKAHSLPLGPLRSEPSRRKNLPIGLSLVGGEVLQRASEGAPSVSVS